MRRLPLVLIALLLAPLVAKAMEDNMAMDQMQAHDCAGAASAAANDPFGPIMLKMHKAMKLPTTGNADRDFLAGMIPHHEGALEMAQVELKRGRDPFALQLAHDIAQAQAREIMVMRELLKTHDFPANASGAEATARFQDAMLQMHKDMPPATGTIDHDFVAGMVPHHQAAIDMANIVVDSGSDDEVEGIALDIIDSQQAELAQMRKWLLTN